MSEMSSYIPVSCITTAEDLHENPIREAYLLDGSRDPRFEWGEKEAGDLKMFAKVKDQISQRLGGDPISISELFDIAAEMSPTIQDLSRTRRKRTIKSTENINGQEVEVVKSITTWQHIQLVTKNLVRGAFPDTEEIYIRTAQDAEQFLLLFSMGITHDMGKLYITRELTDPEKIETPEMRAVIGEDEATYHARVSARILRVVLSSYGIFSSKLIDAAVNAIQYHHILEIIDKGHLNTLEAACLIEPDAKNLFASIVLSDMAGAFGGEKFIPQNVKILAQLLVLLGAEPLDIESLSFDSIYFSKVVGQYVPILLENVQQWSEMREGELLKKITLALQEAIETIGEWCQLSVELAKRSAKLVLQLIIEYLQSPQMAYVLS